MGKTENPNMVVRNFKTFLVIIDRTLISDIKDLNNTVNQLDLIDIYRTFYHKTVEYTPLSRTDITNETGHTVHHKRSLSILKRTQLIQYMFFKYTRIKLEMNSRKASRKSPNIWKLNRS